MLLDLGVAVAVFGRVFVTFDEVIIIVVLIKMAKKKKKKADGPGRVEGSGRKQGTGNYKTTEDRKDAKKAANRRQYDRRRRPSATEVVRAATPWSKHKIMELKFPGFDDTLRDLRDFMLSRMYWPHKDHIKVLSLIHISEPTRPY